MHGLPACTNDVTYSVHPFLLDFYIQPDKSKFSKYKDLVLMTFETEKDFAYNIFDKELSDS